MLPEEEKEKVQKGGSQFADVSQYLAANKDQAKRLASSVGQNVVQAGNVAREAAKPIASQFNQQVNAATVPYNQALSQRATQDPRSFYQGYQAIPQAPQNAREWREQRSSKTKQGGNFGDLNRYLSQGKRMPIVGNQTQPEPVLPQITDANATDTADFNRMRDANYTGPNALSDSADYAGALEKQQTATDLASKAGTEVGREDLLDPLYEGSRGGSFLDQLLLGGGGAKGILDQSAAQNADLGGALESANEASIAEADKARQTTNETGQRVRGDLDTALSTLQGQQAALPTRAGGAPWKRMQQQNQQADMQQRLDALRRLMGTNQ